MYTEKKYKYWFFYIKPEYLNLVYTEEEDSLLYAYTDNEEYSRLFKEQRDMNKFFVKKRKIKKDEVNYLAKNFTSEYLIKKQIKTRASSSSLKIIYYDLVLNKNEDHITQSSINKALMIDMWKYAWLNPYIFNDKYLKLLTNIGFTDKFNTLSNWKTSEKEVNKMGDNSYPDYLSAFIKEYGFLLAYKKGD